VPQVVQVVPPEAAAAVVVVAPPSAVLVVQVVAVRFVFIVGHKVKRLTYQTQE
jgi:hypothetical protein